MKQSLVYAPLALALALIIDLFLPKAASAADAKAVQIIVKVVADDLERDRPDQRPAEFAIDVAKYAAEQSMDPATLQVVEWDDKQQTSVGGVLPLRWYDASVPYAFPECEQNVHATDGMNLQFINRPRWGDFYNLLGEGRAGRLVWIHTQSDESVEYRISFELLARGERPTRLATRGFVGDGSHRCAAIGATTTGVIHSRVDVADWDADGLLDLFVGGSRGHVLWYRNTGSKQGPEFSPPRLIMTTDGRPLDVGWSSAPCIVDWDNDGDVDLLTGAERNRVLFYENEANDCRVEPRLVNRGFVDADGQPLALPTEPVAKSPAGVYELDYYPVLDAVDWNDDSHTDLLAGGYITGRVYYYEREDIADEEVKLHFRGPINADGQPLNVGDWAAAPSAADYDGDGDLDLICGNMPLTSGGADSSSADTFLRYYENKGDSRQPQLVERRLPREGQFPNAALATPRAADFNDDGLLDLVVSSGENIYLYFNRGSRSQPLFEVNTSSLPGIWGSMSLPTFGLQFVDWNRDQRTDLLSGLTIYLNQGPNEYQPHSLLTSGNRIEHPAKHGDPWMFTQLADFDSDGRLDLLYGTNEGHVWWHRNLLHDPPRFDESGAKLLLEDGSAIKVGPLAGQKVDFDVLQGARTAVASADFDVDGLVDLVVGDTYGKVRYYQNVGTANQPRFAQPLLLGDMRIRMVPYAADWDEDGRSDVIGSNAAGEVTWWRNNRDGTFGSPSPINMPAVPYGPFAAVADWNEDGDSDLVVGTAYNYFCWFERSFLEHGYAAVEQVSFEVQ